MRDILILPTKKNQQQGLNDEKITENEGEDKKANHGLDYPFFDLVSFLSPMEPWIMILIPVFHAGLDSQLNRETHTERER